MSPGIRLPTHHNDGVQRVRHRIGSAVRDDPPRPESAIELIGCLAARVFDIRVPCIAGESAVARIPVQEHAIGSRVEDDEDGSRG
jgi:hypothetical protein